MLANTKATVVCVAQLRRLSLMTVSRLCGSARRDEPHGGRCGGGAKKNTTMNPYPKPEKKKRKITYPCSDGSRLTQDQINARLTKAKKEKGPKLRCEAYGSAYDPDEHGPIDNDHTISVNQCKNLRKSELIFDINNMVHNSRQAHKEWESYRSGMFEDHLNVVPRMLYLKKHDPEGFEKRKACISNYEVMMAIS